jgi:hypothetical protein
MKSINLPAGMLLAFIVTFLAACGSGSSDPAPVNSTPDSEAVLLSGDDNDTAISAVISLSPTPVDPDQIKAKGLLSTRLDAVINPAATVAEVNTALQSVGAKIDGMVEGNPVVVLNIPEVTDQAAAQVVADSLQAKDAFLFVSVTFDANTVSTNLNIPVLGNELRRARTALQHNIPADWHEAAHFPALSRADVGPPPTLNQPVTMVVPNIYSLAETLTTNIPNQFFLTGEFAGESVEYGAGVFNSIEGSYGYSISSVISNTDITGAYPNPGSDLLQIASSQLGGLSYEATIIAIQNSLRESVFSTTPDAKFILNTNFTYVDDDFSGRSRIWRAIDALRWRSIGSGFLHIASVGDLGESTGAARHADYSSPFAVSEAYPNLQDLILEDPDIVFNSDAVFNFLLLRTALSDPSPIGNLLVVGSSQLDGFTRSSFSTPGADVRMIGEDVLASCYSSNLPCEIGQWFLSNTDAASAQLAGLAAWMLNMDSTLTNNAVIEAIKHIYQNGQLVGIVDTYAALLALDSSLSGSPIRKRIMDVTDSTELGAPDGVFDDNDINQWVNTVLPDFEDGLPFDLNGDGHIGGSDTVWFDLDVNALPEYNTDLASSTRNFNEKAVTDLDVLCYYAYSELFSGDETRRDEILLGECAPLAMGEIAVELSFAPSIMSGTSTLLTIRAGIRLGANSIDYQAGINIHARAGDASQSVTGTTNDSGIFTVFITPDIDAGLYSHLVTASKDGVATTDVAILTINSSNMDVGDFAFTDGRGLFVRNNDGSITPLADFIVDYPAWSPDGSKIAFRSFADSVENDIFTIDPDGSNLTGLTGNDSDHVSRGPNWSPDSSKIVYSTFSLSSPDRTEFSINRDGTEETQLPINSSASIRLTSMPNAIWSPDGSKILYNQTNALYSVDLVTLSNTLLATDFDPLSFRTIINREGEWSPDGGKIVFNSNLDVLSGAFDIYVVDADGTNLVRLTTSSGSTRNSRPAWSLDGSMIAFFQLPTGTGANLMIMNADGTNLRMLVPDEVDDSWSPRWSPDSTRVLFGEPSGNQIHLIHVDGIGRVNMSNSPTGAFFPSLKP